MSSLDRFILITDFHEVFGLSLRESSYQVILHIGCVELRWAACSVWFWCLWLLVTPTSIFENICVICNICVCSIYIYICIYLCMSTYGRSLHATGEDRAQTVVDLLKTISVYCSRNVFSVYTAWHPMSCVSHAFCCTYCCSAVFVGGSAHCREWCPVGKMKTRNFVRSICDTGRHMYRLADGTD